MLISVSAKLWLVAALRSRSVRQTRMRASFAVYAAAMFAVASVLQLSTMTHSQFW
jgi:hypothetical protein